MQNRTIGIIATVVTTLVCGCAGLFSCIFGFMIASGATFDMTINGVKTPQTFPPTIGLVLLCLTLLMILVPIAVGFFTLRRKPEATIEVVPPAS